MTLDADARRFSNLLAEHERRLNNLERGGNADQLAHSSLEDTGLPSYDADGMVRQIVGKQSDGTFAVTYGNGPQPPRPSAPTTSGHQLSVVTYWDGLFADGATRPADVQRVDVHMSTTQGFMPDGTTVIGSMTAEGVVGIVADLVPRYVKLVAVTTSDTASDPSDEVTVTALPASELAAESIGATELAAVLVLATRIVAGDPTGARAELNATGFEGYDPSGDRTIFIDGSTGDVTVKGEYRTADSGERIVINEGGVNARTIRFYDEADEHASLGRIDGSTQSQWKSSTQAGTTDDHGWVYVDTAFAGLAHGTPLGMKHSEVNAVYDSVRLSCNNVSENRQSSWLDLTEVDQIRMAAQYIELDATRNYSEATTTPSKIFFKHWDTSGVSTDSAQLEMKPSQLGEAWLLAYHQDIGLIFGDTTDLYAVDRTNTQGRRIQASDFVVYSGSESKREIREFPFSGLDAVRATPAKMWKRLRPEPDPAPELRADAGAAEPDTAATPDPWHYGPVADELPHQLVEVDDRDGQQRMSLGDLNATVWQAVRELAERVDALGARIAALETGGS